MKTTINKTELAGALAALGKLVCRSSPIPVYRAVQIEACTPEAEGVQSLPSGFFYSLLADEAEI